VTRRDEHTSPLGRIILARAQVLGPRRRGGDDTRPLSLKEMSDEVYRLTGQKLTRGAINEWILGRVKRPTPELMSLLAAALADWDCDRHTLERDMRAAVGLPADVPEESTVDCTGLAEDDVATLNAIADRLREKGREAAEAAVGAAERVARFTPVTQGAFGRATRAGDVAAVGG
jgi:hypothetical protein